MPYIVWVGMADPNPAALDEPGRALLSRLILDVASADWGVPAVTHPPDTTADDGTGPRSHHSGDLAGLRVQPHPRGALISMTIETDVLDDALLAGSRLGRRISGAAPSLLGWTVEHVRAQRLSPLTGGDWYPEPEGSPWRPVAAHLPDPLRALSARYLVAAAVRDLADPAGRTGHRVDAAELAEAAARDHPWGRELVSALGELMVVAGRAEAEAGRRTRLTGRGGGQTDLPEALLHRVRAEIDVPSTGFRDDTMRGRALIDQFVDDMGLSWDDAGDARHEDPGHRPLWHLLWAGLRVLATLSGDGTNDARSPWLWLDALGADHADPLVGVLAELDRTSLAYAERDTSHQLSAAAEAHLLIRAALLHTSFLDPAVGTLTGCLDRPQVTESLQHIAYETLTAMGPAAVCVAGQGLDRLPGAAVVARDLIPALRALGAEHQAGDPSDDLHRAMERLLHEADPGGAGPSGAHTLLNLITRAAAEHGEERAAELARDLFARPSDAACLLLNGVDEGQADDRLRRHILARAAALDPTMAGRIAADLPALDSDDPRDRPALRVQARSWWSDTARRLAHHDLDQGQFPTFPGLGSALLRAFTGSGAAGAIRALADMPTSIAVVAVVQAISALSIATGRPELPLEVLTRR
ncbi:MAG: hypothetical protein WCA46_15000 [Actinocatenispora sp.]